MTTPHTPRSLLDTLRAINGAVAVVGSANADLTVRTEGLPRSGQTVAGEPLQILSGGKSANQAVQAARLGARVSFIGAIGDDVHGDLLRASLHGSGVDIEGSRLSAQPTGTAVITVDRSGENTIVVSPGANEEVDADLVTTHASIIGAAQTLGLCLETPIGGVLEAARIAAASGTAVLLNLSPFIHVPAELLGLTDVLIVNEHELVDLLDLRFEISSLTHDTPSQQFLADRLAELGVHHAIVTLGPMGSLVVDGACAAHVPSVEINALDTTGCGDAFFGTVLAARAGGATLLEAAQLASRVASAAAARLGAQASYLHRSEIVL